MKIIADTSVLIERSLFWEFKKDGKCIQIKQKNHSICDQLFNYFRRTQKQSWCIITKTAEDEAFHVLNKAITNELKIASKTYLSDLLKYYDYMKLQYTITQACEKRLNETIEECSIRLSIDKKAVYSILNNEIEPFFCKIIPQTTRFIPIPNIFKKLKGSSDDRKELLGTQAPILQSDAVLYVRGDPKPIDKMIMAEATYFCRKYNKEVIFIASLDNHFIPNPRQIGSYEDKLCIYDSTSNGIKVDPTVRDMLKKKFGFIGERPEIILEELQKTE